MDYSKIKEKSKKLIEGKLWILIQPYLYLILISMLAGGFIGIIAGDNTHVKNFLGWIYCLLSMPLSFGVVIYYLNFVRKKKLDIYVVFKKFDKIVPLIALSLLTAFFVVLWSFLFIIPGIIAAISYSMAIFIMADGEEDPLRCIEKSKAMMKGYKANYFCFMFSFIGWFILGALTFGILYIWVIPYVSIAQILYYEEVKKNSTKKIDKSKK